MESPDILMNSGLPVVTAFVLGLLTAISPCPLATNITAIGFISRDIGNRKRIFRNGLLYKDFQKVYLMAGHLFLFSGPAGYPHFTGRSKYVRHTKRNQSVGGMDYFTFTIAYRWIYAMGSTVESSEIRFFGRQ